MAVVKENLFTDKNERIIVYPFEYNSYNLLFKKGIFLPYSWIYTYDGKNRLETIPLLCKDSSDYSNNSLFAPKSSK